MTTPSYTCRYMAAILFFGFPGFLAFCAQDGGEADRYANCISRHPTWSIEECGHIAKGETWMDMSDEQRAAAEQSLSARPARRKKRMKPAAVAAPVADASPASLATGTQTGGEGKGLWILALVFVGAAFYLLPAIVSSARHHHQSTAIWVLNIFLGWTVLGWVASLVWAASATPGEAKT